MTRLWSKLQQNKNKGFSLVEVIIAMTILAVVAVPLLKYFSDSLKYSAQMAVRQKATALAQQTVEDIKMDTNLWDTMLKDLNPNPAPAGGVTSLTLGGDTYSIVTNNIDATTGIGDITLSKSTGSYDVVVKVDTALDINDVDHAVIYGIDDHEDVMAVERDQMTEALMYFMAINNIYVMNVAASDPTITFMSEDDILAAMTREMIFDINYDQALDIFTIQGYYKYTADGLQGTGSSDDYISGYVMDVKTKTLTNIYVLFDRMLKADGTPKKDVMTITKSGDVFPATSGIPTLVLICQNLPSDNSNSTYEMEIGMPTGFTMPVRSNILSTASPQTGQLKYLGAGNIDTKGLSDTKKSIRILGMEVSVFKQSHADTDTAYAVMSTTKGD